MSTWGQKVASVGLLVAFVACLLGAVSPYWRTGQMETNSTGFHDSQSSLSKAEETLTYHGGLFYFCVDIPGGGSECDLFHFTKGNRSELNILYLTVAQMTLALLCFITSLCCVCRAKDEDPAYRCQGIVAGLVGIAGVAATVMYLVSPGDSYGLILHSLELSWSLLAFAVGTLVYVIMSLGLCLASPNGICPCVVVRRRGYEDLEAKVVSDKSAK